MPGSDSLIRPPVVEVFKLQNKAVFEAVTQSNHSGELILYQVALEGRLQRRTVISAKIGRLSTHL
jgi:hypothetical protein